MSLRPSSGPSTPVELEARLERKHTGLGAFVFVPAAAIAGWGLAGTTTIVGTVDGVSLGRRSIHRWDDERWCVDLPLPLLGALGKEVGASARLVLSVAPTELPPELSAVIEADPEARARWDSRTDAQRRMLREHVGAAKTAATRERRAREALAPPTDAPAAPIEGLPAVWTRVLLRIDADRLPGAACGRWSEVRVGLQVGREATALVSAGEVAAAWEAPIEVREGPRFRGEAVHGPPDERFVYLTWHGRDGGGPDAMFRRAKLRLDAVPGEVLVAAVRSGRLWARLGLTAADGTPVCASVKPPAIGWTAGSLASR